MDLRLDANDRELLEELERDAGRTKKQLARRLNLPLTTVHNRVKRLEKAGVIRRYAAIVDRKKTGRGVGAFIDITVNYVSPDFSQQGIARKLAAMPEVEEVAIVTGNTDLQIKVHVGSTDALNEFITKKLRSLKGIDKTNTAVILQEMEREEGKALRGTAAF